MKTSFIRTLFTVAAVSGLAVFAASCNGGGGGNNWQIEGVTGPTVVETSANATISAIFQNLTVSVDATIPIPHMPNSTIVLAPVANNGGLQLTVNVNAADLVALADANLLPPQDLPGGRPLPGVPAGELPMLAVQVPQLDNVTFYIGPNAFGIFVPVQFSVGQIVGFYDYYDASNQLRGEISIVGDDSTGKNSGFLLMLNWGVPAPTPSASPSPAPNSLVN